MGANHSKTLLANHNQNWALIWAPWTTIPFVYTDGNSENRELPQELVYTNSLLLWAVPFSLFSHIFRNSQQKMNDPTEIFRQKQTFFLPAFSTNGQYLENGGKETVYLS